MRAQYWLGVSNKYHLNILSYINLFNVQHGASPTRAAHRLLEKFGFVPKLPVPLGSKHLYEKPERDYQADYYKFKEKFKG